MKNIEKIGMVVVLSFMVCSCEDNKEENTVENSIVFVSERDGNREIYSMALDGSNQENLTKTPLNEDYSPVLSNDGSKIVYVSGLNNSVYLSEIFSLNTNDNTIVNLTNSGSTELRPSISPNEDKIAYISSAYDNGNICIMDIDGNNKILLGTEFNWIDGAIQFLPNNNDIIFYGSYNGSNNILKYTLSNTLLSQLTSTGTGSYPIVSPDGTQIVYSDIVTYSHSTIQLFAMDINGNTKTQLTQITTSNASNPSFSINGTKIVFDSGFEGNGEVYLVSISGGELTNITNTPDIDEYNPIFFDDNTIICVGTTEDRQELFSISIDANEVSQLTTDGGFDPIIK